MTVRADGLDVVVDGDEPVRAVYLELTWDDALDVTAIAPAGDAAGFNLLRVDLPAGERRARVLLSDSRRLLLPRRGTILRATATGDGALRVLSASAATSPASGAGEPRAVTVEVE